MTGIELFLGFVCGVGVMIVVGYGLLVYWFKDVWR